MPSVDRSDSPDDREKDDGRGGNKKSASSKAKDLSHVPCKFYKVGSCTAGSSCPFSHSLVEPGGQKDVCAWFVKGNCKFGHKCALAHVLPGQTMAMDRKNKKAAQIAAGGAKNNEGRGRGGSKRDGGNNARNPLSGLVGGSTAPTRARPMNMPLKATISPSAPAPPLKDTDFASFGVLDEANQLPTAPARKKSPSPTGTKPPSPTLPVSAPRRPSMSGPPPNKDFGPIGSPPSSATSPSRNHHASSTPPTQANGFLSTSPFSAPGTQSVFLGYGESGRKGMAASLGSGMAMGGGPGGWNGSGSQVSSSPMRASLLSASRMNGRGNGEFDISVEYEEYGVKGRRKATREDSNEDLEDFLPSSLTDLLTPEERSRRMSRTNSGQSPSGGGSSPHRHGLGVPLGHNAGAAGGGHRYSRSVPAPSLLGGDLKSIWSADQGGPPPNPHVHQTAAGMPASPMAHGPSSYSSTSFDGNPSSFVDDMGNGMRNIPSLSPSNASAAFLPGIHHYIAQNKQQGSRTTSNPVTNANGMFSSNASHLQGPPGIAHYLQAGPAGPSGAHNALNSSGSPYVRPNPFDLTQQMHHSPAPQGPPGIPGPGAGDSHILSPNARALQAHAPGQSLPQGLAAGYSRIHALPPLPSAAGSPSPAAFGASPVNTGPTFGGRDWSTMSNGSVSGSPGLSFMPSAAAMNANAKAAAGTPKSFVPAASPPPNAGAQGLDAMFSRLSYSAAAAVRQGGPPAAPAQMQRNPSGGGRWQGAAPLSPLSRPVVTGADDDLFPLDE
ncbi:hypothetical protein B0H15DRAFT_817998 [Mycena belliarum]|uniref:C3H1-type domain-containing protein n=1 Tax=Mycena belliarum TaxID=1033014 RepID=A0AAD6UDR9_9AGAR|nr:hypothetical protein B0H15DRAFT_817998 [Mycena belliae]